MFDIMFEKAGEVYRLLQDEESRDIYCKRFMLNVTGEWKYAREIVAKYLRGYNSDRIFTGLADSLRELQLSPGSEYIIYGAGMYGKQALAEMKRQKLTIRAFCDMDKRKQEEGYCRLDVISPESLADYPEAKIVLTVWNQSDRIINFLRSINISEERIIDGFQVENFVDKSQYFAPDIIKLQEDEVFVDCGCFDFETAEIFREKCPNYKKIICFEPDEQNRSNILQKVREIAAEAVEIQPYGVWNKKDTLYFQGAGSSAAIAEKGDTVVAVAAIDDIIQERVTFIKMDIEGAELEALMGAKETIKKYRPKLAIAVYHKPEDIITIPNYISGLVPEYKLYMRHYSNYYATETVLYAVV